MPAKQFPHGCNRQPELSSSLPLDETLLRFNQVPKYLPRNGNGKLIGLSSVYRWASKGVRGVRLESWQCPWGRITSLQALERFLNALTQQRPPVDAPQARTPRQRSRRARKAEEFLQAELGIGAETKKGGA
jgi:hypothetical protein